MHAMETDTAGAQRSKRKGKNSYTDSEIRKKKKNFTDSENRKIIAIYAEQK